MTRVAVALVADAVAAEAAAVANPAGAGEAEALVAVAAAEAVAAAGEAADAAAGRKRAKEPAEVLVPRAIHRLRDPSDPKKVYNALKEQLNARYGCACEELLAVTTVLITKG